MRARVRRPQEEAVANPLFGSHDPCPHAGSNRQQADLDRFRRLLDAAAMARRKLKAIFRDGTIDIVTEKSFTHAWRVSGTTVGGPQAIDGWARNEQAAAEAAAIYARHQRQQLRWRNVQWEVVAVEVESQ